MPDILDQIKSLTKKGREKMILLVVDGLGGLPHPDFGGKSEMEAARTPNLDGLARRSVLGLMDLVNHGITPGSGPGHIGLLGYDPESLLIGRGVLEALGVGFHLQDGDIAARANFATADPAGVIIDRRAGRISTEECRRIVGRISEAIREIDGVQIILEPGIEHRFVMVLRGAASGDRIRDTDPQKEGYKPYSPDALDETSEKASQVVRKFLEKALPLVVGEPKANAILLRGFAESPELERFPERYGVKPLAIALYPMYKGIARLFGFETPELSGTLEDEIRYLEEQWESYDFFFVHYKDTDKAGEDGDFARKVECLEYFDRFIPAVLNLKPDVLVVTGDHSTPALLKSHSWHPSPVLLHSPYAGADDRTRFTERECKNGYLGRFPARGLISLMLANALRMNKYGA
ncbi:MAG TPA: 2,3-bisphosphoglycerate-independent phosphoglycerate mutase [Atribacteraceae bacterium]|nr:2,3-bisphosphoglycerate-independent phosphoglycerate mutase [Atribacteraceae bacterium]